MSKINLSTLLEELQYYIKAGSCPAGYSLKLLESFKAAMEREEITADTLHDYLEITRNPIFLNGLNSREIRYRWAESAFAAIRISGYNFKSMFDGRVKEHPERPLFKTLEGAEETAYSYQRVYNAAKLIAASFYRLTNGNPSAAIFSENSLESAITDIACLTYDILISPINVHFDREVLYEIHKRLGINLFLADSDQRFRKLIDMRDHYNADFIIVYSGYESIPTDERTFILGKLLTSMKMEDADLILSERKRFSLDDMATVMFTSGSSGIPKGIAYNQFNIVTKRFARGAALPDVGVDETLLSFLPLYHTFGRYLEMLGMIYWGGTYVFAGNPSFETLLALMPRVNPTGLISIPLRWSQIKETSMERSLSLALSEEAAFRSCVGSRLRWGLSAAGYLDPKVFQFFQKNGVELCSGFGMTEATGGISMTPPGEYVEDSVGIPLPGIEVRFKETGELEISGVYVAKYLDDYYTEGDNYWLSTGDLFVREPNGHLRIIDRIKDIYKNVKGQTIAPRRIEKIFEEAAGIKRAFVAGDGKAYNTLLLVIDDKDKTIQAVQKQDKLREYFNSLISLANASLAPFERIINFSILPRDFDKDKKEITAKETYNRKIIEANFAEDIAKLYKQQSASFIIGKYTVIVPFWLIRDLGITEDELALSPEGIINKQTNSVLKIKAGEKEGQILVGEFIYEVSSDKIDLGVFVRQPYLWTGNIGLLSFAVCKDGWETKYPGISQRVHLTGRVCSENDIAPLIKTEGIADPKLKDISLTCAAALFSCGKSSARAALELQRYLKAESPLYADLIRRRIEALSDHPEFATRSLAYQILLFDEPGLDYSRYLPAFINSGKQFLDSESIEALSRRHFEKERLDALRQRLAAYRTDIEAGGSHGLDQPLKDILELLVNFGLKNFSVYGAVRAELINWILFREAPELAKHAALLFERISSRFELRFILTEYEQDISNWRNRVIFQQGMNEFEIDRIERILFRTSFLKEAVFLIFDDDRFSLSDIPENGIWISRLLSSHNNYLYRISANTRGEKHYDIILLLKDDLNQTYILETIYWMIKIGSYPAGISSMPRFGAFSSSLKAASFAFVNELTVWDKIREYSSSRTISPTFGEELRWRKQFTRGIAAFFTSWKYSGYKIAPGFIAPTNVALPEQDFKEAAKILSISGWTRYKNPASLVNPMLANFYAQTTVNYPWEKNILKIDWLFDACLESLGFEEGKKFLIELTEVIDEITVLVPGADFKEALTAYLRKLAEHPYLPLSLELAAERYAEWILENPSSTKEARNQFIQKLYLLYHLEDYGDIIRYALYAKTYFKDSGAQIVNSFTKLLSAMHLKRGVPPAKLFEISALQDALTDSADRAVFSGVVFPEIARPLRIEFVPVGAEESRDLILKTFFENRGRKYSVRKSSSPYEASALYRLFVLSEYPIRISSDIQFLLLFEGEEERLIGGIIYKTQGEFVVNLEGLVIAPAFRNLGLGGALLEDFCSRLSSEGFKAVVTYYTNRQFFEKYNFRIDSRWGGLVRFLSRTKNLFNFE